MINIYKDGRSSAEKLEMIVKFLSDQDILILISDGVLNIFDTSLKLSDCRIYILRDDLESRGLCADKTPIGECISMEEMVDLIANDQNSPISW